MDDGIQVGDVYIDHQGKRWIVQDGDPYFPEQYGEGLSLIYDGANLLSIGDRLPIRYAEKMTRETMDEGG